MLSLYTEASPFSSEVRKAPDSLFMYFILGHGGITEASDASVLISRRKNERGLRLAPFDFD